MTLAKHAWKIERASRGPSIFTDHGTAKAVRIAYQFRFSVKFISPLAHHIENISDPEDRMGKVHMTDESDRILSVGTELPASRR